MGFEITRSSLVGLVILLVCHGALADRAGERSPAENWQALVAMLQAYIDKNREGFEEIMAPLDSLRPYQIDWAPDGLDVRWSKESELVKAPDAMTERIRTHFEAAGLMMLQYAPGLVQFVPRAGDYGYKGRSIFFVIVHSEKTYEAPECTEALLLESEEEFGRCWLPMKPDKWYVDFAWVYTEHQRAAYESSGTVEAH